MMTARKKILHSILSSSDHIIRASATGSHIASVPLSSPITQSIGLLHMPDLLPSPKRIRSPESATDLEDSFPQRVLTFSRTKRTDLRNGYRGMMPRLLKSVQRDKTTRSVATGQQSADMLERIRELERDNRQCPDYPDLERQGHVKGINKQNRAARLARIVLGELVTLPKEPELPFIGIWG
ncbi:hypothetical protein Tco_0784931 [Tanacetum coccineum]